MGRENRCKFEPIDMNKYRGEWIAFVDGKIVSHGRVLSDVLEKARKIGKDPVIDKVPEQDTLVV